MKAKADKAEDGGWGWVVVFAGMVVYFLVFGALRCQSILFVPIVEEFNSDFSAVAWVSSIATAGFSIAGVLSAPLISKLGHRWTVIVGGVVAATGSLLASFAPSLFLLDVTAGMITGIGLGIAFVPSPVIIGHYFTKRRSLATNIASVGSSIGTLAVCPMNQVIIDAYALRGYFLILGGIFLNICVAGALFRPPPKPQTTPSTKEADKQKMAADDAVELIEVSSAVSRDVGRSHDTASVASSAEGAVEDNAQPALDDTLVEEDAAMVETEVENKEIKQPKYCGSLRESALWSPPYIVYCISQVVFLAGFLCNQLYIVPYAEIEAGVPKLQASLLMSIGAFVEIGSRLLFGVLGDMKRIDRVWLFAGVLFVLSFFAAILPLMKTFASLAAIAALTGLFQGGFSGISVVILADIVGLKNYAAGLGISTLLNGIGTLLTPPAVGWTVDQTGKPSTALFVSAGILFLGAILSAMIKVTINHENRKSKRRTAEAQETST